MKYEICSNKECMKMQKTMRLVKHLIDYKNKKHYYQCEYIGWCPEPVNVITIDAKEYMKELK